jgi:hypothetical protein
LNFLFPAHLTSLTMSDDDMYDFGGGHSAAPKPASRSHGREMKAKGVPAAVHKSPAKSMGGDDDDDDYGDDDFEDYGDDFEDEEEETQVPAPAPAPAAAPRKIDMSKVGGAGNNNNNMAEEKMPASQMRSDATSKSKGSKSSSRGAPVLKDLNNKFDKENTSGQTQIDEAGGKVPKLSAATRRKVRQFSSMSMSSNPSNFGSGFRAKRLQKLYASQVMDLQEEKFTNFHIPAVSPMDGYLRKLRATNALIKQSGVPAEDETRSVEVATEDTLTEDKGVQFCYGDDTDLLLIMDRISRQKEAKKKGIEIKEDDNDKIMDKKKTVEASTISTQAQLDDESYDQSGGTTRLNSFLQSAAQVCERLIEEDAMQNPERGHIDRSSTHGSLFSDDSQWTSVASNLSGATELIRMRKITGCKFSSLQPQLLLTMHPYDEKDEDDLMPYKGLFCVWNVTTPSAPPNFVLVGAGNPSCCSFSSTQTFLICAGTDEGTLHLWDLREASALHRDRDAIDLGIDRGIRKACYSTATLIDGTVSLESGDNNSLQQQSLIEGGQHAAPITQLVAIGVSESNAASTSQFASMDQTGLICLWVTGLQHTEDMGLSPWGKVALVFTRSLHVNQSVDEASFLTSSVLAAVPGDVSTLLAASSKGSVKKVVRFGNAPSPQSLNRSEASTIEISFGRSSTSDRAFSDVALYADVTTISVQAKTEVRYRSEAKEDLNTSTTTPIPPDMSSVNDTAQLVLVGRADGSIDLFKMDVPTPLQTWKLSQLLGIKDRSASQRSIPSVAVVQWIPNKHSAFLIIDTKGNCFLFDLLLSPHNPLCTERLPIAHTQVLDLSPCRNGSTVAYLAALGEDGHIKVRPLWEGWLRSSPDDPFRLLDSLSLWSLRTVEDGGKLSFQHAESK